MTKHISSEQLLYDKNDEQQEPFQIVLVDIEMAANHKVIHCVKKPLEGNTSTLNFVALSYRWGELQETMIDTQVDYVATVTSFDLQDFYLLCRVMMKEADLKHIKYVWVDTICVDQNPTKRKKTIYQMTNIYEQATYIVAVPDLHSAYLRNTSTKNDDIMKASGRYGESLYHLIHGNYDKLSAMEDEFLSNSGVPNNPALRKVLTQFTDYFVDSFMKFKEHHYLYKPVQSLDHVYEISKAEDQTPIDQDHVQAEDFMSSGDGRFLHGLHYCENEECPLVLYNKQPFYTSRYIEFDWKQSIYERGTAIRQSMEFLTDLIKDWSSRVWVMSEYNIAKRKNNLKYWFLQLASSNSTGGLSFPGLQSFSFFKFDFDNPSFSTAILNTTMYANATVSLRTREHTSNPVYIQFHYMMIKQLSTQTFLQMMLTSKASRNEDRFYSILPLSEYKSKLVSKNEVDQWKIHSLLSVKLKLYDIMNTKDKWTLLFWSGNKTSSNKGMVLPTFATSTLSAAAHIDQLIFNDHSKHTADYISVLPAKATTTFPFSTEDDVATLYGSVSISCNFDLTDPSSMMLHQDNSYDYLCVKPNKYYVYCNPHGGTLKSQQTFLKKETFCRHVGLDDTSPLDVVCIPAFDIGGGSYYIFLVGSFFKNKWLLDQHQHFDMFTDTSFWAHHINKCVTFDIY